VSKRKAKAQGLNPKDERYTPESILDIIREFDVIGFDPCTTRDNRCNALSHAWFDPADPDSHGLTCKWSPGHGLIWVNHPYSAGQPYRWACKMYVAGGNGCEIISLGAADTSTRANKLLLLSANAVAFWDKRIAFLKPDGKYELGAKFANASFYFGERQGRFKRVFSPHATVLVLR
jgi:hypothetical protein